MRCTNGRRMGCASGRWRTCWAGRAGGADDDGAPTRGCNGSGDVSLFVAGFFARSFARKLIDIDYHIAMGRQCVQLARGTPCSARCRVAAWRRSTRSWPRSFQRLVDALNEVSEMSYRHTDADLLRLYEVWMKTGSPRARGLLNQVGRAARASGRHAARALGH